MIDADALVQHCFEIISYAGGAKGKYVSAIAKMKDAKRDEALELIKEGDEAFESGHAVHLNLLQATATGEMSGANLLLIHAEDQMAAAETFRILADDFMDVYQKFEELARKQ